MVISAYVHMPRPAWADQLRGREDRVCSMRYIALTIIPANSDTPPYRNSLVPTRVTCWLATSQHPAAAAEGSGVSQSVVRLGQERVSQLVGQDMVGRLSRWMVCALVNRWYVGTGRWVVVWLGYGWCVWSPNPTWQSYVFREERDDLSPNPTHDL